MLGHGFADADRRGGYRGIPEAMLGRAPESEEVVRELPRLGIEKENAPE
jgi:hypothetical protein